ncbi:acylneuraminate cytidylyltransferase family protein [Xenorhabdus bovienii]|uniref:acylneuraminate cytidylyltransferase family protein n=1 Tax=Xenorhabdus bovienii TaxID=40576 RepID=UPI0023B2B94F|nr:acylneuraminate cytidylyltransferase family protein [Xenorhabdus bovienii]MDE9493201.1 acylneuraminate cytidylyltransferase family protein [Xenorhabdus bovienii]MDE9501737.1 acylneuraminate cytidylyltransferase family protein [Xenorhabdus bovienii]MDE9525521.1 acylneuraminate cytidylyltransferase family protein [Xenorhabdus bovienii]MDE9568042.1 acylneuraminate cytidylyltransferase family protein [Xenorhabdus bovienii]
MKTYSFIFARGGSKGLPRKNIKLFSGKPLIVWSIEIAQRCSSIDKIFVSTDDEEIAKIANNAGAEIIIRPKELATDTSSEWDAWRHAVNFVTKKYGKFSSFISLPATSPLRSVIDVNNALNKLIETQADICLAVTPSNRNPYFNMVKISHSGTTDLLIRTDTNTYRRQDAPETYDLTTVVYVTSPNYILKKKSIFEGNVVSIEVPKERSIDIDDIFDFKFAELLFKESISSRKQS